MKFDEAMKMYELNLLAVIQALTDAGGNAAFILQDCDLRLLRVMSQNNIRIKLEYMK